ncbi:MAG: hypothetical protein IV088_15185 [Hydrogenophaga sp.]|uniref:hypothetical protein n=1 Tax=Hydrogenophaga sp. TaxID=1904254 RepID=UPI0025BB2D87|nr:hypothetical protein [Hydrogenophaga sp.]MBT9552191.1 hypothetical protein [Hydrogenophaga sp.]
MTHIELADAQLADVVLDGGTITLRIPVAPARQPGEGADARPVDGFLQGLVITLLGASLVLDEGTALGECLGAVREGALVVDGQTLRRLPVPAEWRGAVSLNLALRNGASLRISATEVRCATPGGAGFRESLAC